ncbi:hypothetical protein AAVH_27260, partial [Aphelenchoides avenae]
PLLYQYCDASESCQPYAQLVLQTCIISIIVTAPVGQLLLELLGHCALEKQSSEDAGPKPHRVFVEDPSYYSNNGMDSHYAEPPEVSAPSDRRFSERMVM